MKRAERQSHRGKRSPGFRILITAGWIGVLFIVASLLGWREHTSVLSGTAPADSAETLYGLLYILVYFLTVALAPVLGIAGILLTALERLDKNP